MALDRVGTWNLPGITTLVLCVAVVCSGCERQADRTAAAQPRERERERAEPVDHAATPPHVDRAVAVMIPIGDSEVDGTVYFIQHEDEIEVVGIISGLTPGKHGFHVHEYGDLTDREEGESAGDHFNPTGMPHGTPDDRRRHVGDLGNIEADEEGVARIQMRDEQLQLNGPHSILGRSLVVHADEDVFTQPSGDAGPRIGIGIIGVAQPPAPEHAPATGEHRH